MQILPIFAMYYQNLTAQTLFCKLLKLTPLFNQEKVNILTAMLGLLFVRYTTVG